LDHESSDPGFAPADITDDRAAGDWKSRYDDPVAKWWIRAEACYLFVHMVIVIATIFGLAVADSYPGGSAPPASLPNTLSWQQLLHSWLGGVLGGTLFAMKWLYHAVAKNLWHVDRRLWRLFTPHLSGALALAFAILLSSGIVDIVNQEGMASKWACFAICFLVGYFSDNATAKMSEVAKTVFGATQRE
jgi:hypothetical protein